MVAQLVVGVLVRFPAGGEKSPRDPRLEYLIITLSETSELRDWLARLNLFGCAFYI